MQEPGCYSCEEQDKGRTPGSTAGRRERCLASPPTLITAPPRQLRGCRRRLAAFMTQQSLHKQTRSTVTGKKNQTPGNTGWVSGSCQALAEMGPSISLTYLSTAPLDLSVAAPGQPQGLVKLGWLGLGSPKVQVVGLSLLTEQCTGNTTKPKQKPNIWLTHSSVLTLTQSKWAYQ